MLIVVIILFLLIFFPGFLWADNGKPVISINPFVVRGLSPEEGRIAESLIQSYVAVVGEVLTNTNNRRQETAGSGVENLIGAGESRLPDYILSGNIILDGDNHLLILEIQNTRTEETVSYSSSHKTTGELLLKARSMMETAFSPGTVNSGGTFTELREAGPEAFSEGNIVGTWRGDAGIELIRLRPGGRGIAVFSSGVQMNLAYIIEGNALRVVQNSPNTERFYYPVPYAVAKHLVAEAEPMRWEFLLYEKGTALRGIKITTAVRYEGNTVLELLPGTTREAEWTRAAR
ncbi:MAG: hypothetical protein LBQ38_05845 [Spirochaetaceae bacterium]|nr:hypothetical protein [Spirochaetaceae bacterium]